MERPPQHSAPPARNARRKALGSPKEEGFNMTRPITSESLNEKTWSIISHMEPIADIESYTGATGPLAKHSRAFIANRYKRIRKVSRMKIKGQCEYYRGLGYFK